MIKEESNINEKYVSKFSKFTYVIINYVFIATFISIYFLNNNNTLSSYENTRLINLIMTMILLGLLFIYSIKELKLTLITYLLFLIMISISVFVLLIRQYIIFHWIYLAFIILLVKIDIKINVKLKKFMIYTSFIAVLYQMYSIRFLGSVPVLSWLDPNYSAYYIFMLSIFSRKSGNKLISNVLILLGFLTLSRTYMVAIIVYLLLEKSSFLNYLIIRIRIVNFFKLMIISLIVLFTIGSFFIAIEREVTHFTSRGIERIFVINDLSNLHRFIANQKFVESIFSNPNYYLLGTKVEDYQNRVFINTPHNAFLSLIVNYGILFTLPFIILYGISLNKLIDKKNVPLIISQFIFYSLLGAGVQGFPGILLFFTLREEHTDKNIKNNENA